MQLDDLFEAGGVHVSVDLGGRDIGVAKESLHRPQVGPPLEKVGGKGVAQGMGREMFLGPCLKSVSLDQIPKLLTGEGGPLLRDEEVGKIFSLKQEIAGALQILSDPIHRRSAHWNQPLL